MVEKDERFSQEKRRSPRVGGAVVEYYLNNNEEVVKKAFIKDICIHGICIYMPEGVENATEVTMDVFLFGSEAPINTKGKVVWHKTGEYAGYHNVGIEFSKLDEGEKKRLAEHIKVNLPVK